RTGPNGHIELAYDAVNLTLAAAQRAMANLSPPNRQQVYDALRQTHDAQKFPGVTGPIDFTTVDPALPSVGASAPQKMVVVQQVRLARPGSQSLMSTYVY